MRIGIIGCGSAGSRHARNLHEMGHDLALFDPAVERVRALVSGFDSGGVRAFGSPEEIFDAGVDACVVASSTDSHVEYASAALSQNVPCFVEKPLAVSYTEGLGIVELASHSAAPLMVGYNLRFLEPIALAKEALDGGEIGNPLAASFWFGYDLRLWRPHLDYRKTYSAERRRGGGVLLEASHEIDLAVWLFGAAESAYGILRRSGLIDADVEDMAAAILETESGVVVSLALDMVSPRYRRGFEITGEDGSMSWRWPRNDVEVVRRNDRDDRPDAGDEPAPVDLDGSYRSELAYFLDCLRSGEHPRPDAADGLHVLAVVEAITVASETGAVARVPTSGGDIESIE